MTTTSHACAHGAHAHEAINNSGIAYAVNIVDCVYWRKVCMYRHMPNTFKRMQHAQAFDPALLLPCVQPRPALQTWLSACYSPAVSLKDMQPCA